MSLIPVLPEPIRRDRYGRYVVLAPDGKKPEGYTRATTVAKALDDTSNLMAWGRRMTALGLAARPDLLALVQTTDNTDKKALDRLCESASEAGGATARRDLGTALHKMFEESCVTPGYEPPATYAADILAIHQALRAAGLQVVDECSELMVVIDRHKIAGMADLIVERISDGQLFIADLKTGSSVEWGALGWAIQLSIYANADAIYIQGTAADGSEDLRAPMPVVNKDEAIIIHCEPESGSCDLHTLDIKRGFEALEVAIGVREWRKKRKLLIPFKSAGGEVPVEAVVAPTEPAASTTVLPEAVSTATGSGGAGGVTASSVEQIAATPPAPDTTHITADEAALEERDHMLHIRRLWLLERIRIIGEQGFISTLQAEWPDGCAGPKAVRSRQAKWNIAETAAVVKCVDAVEMAHDLPFGATDPELAQRLKLEETERFVRAATGAGLTNQTAN
jgi:hypothetical protein